MRNKLILILSIALFVFGCTRPEADYDNYFVPPDAVTHLVASTAAGGTVKLYWNLSYNSKEIKSSIISWSPKDGSLKDSSTTSATITGLKDDVNYTFSVKVVDEYGGESNENITQLKSVVTGVEGVYSYQLNVADVATAWGGSSASPVFSVLLMTDEQAADCVYWKEAFKEASAATPVSQIAAHDNCIIADTSTDGNFAVYGKAAVDDVFLYYNGVAATVSGDKLTVFVNMPALVKTDLWALFLKNADGKDGAVMANDDIVELKGYKPYVLALASKANDPNNFVVSGWSADLMKMTSGASFPGSLKKNAPAVPTCLDLTSVAGTVNEWKHTALTNRTFEFDGAADTAFAFTNGTWNFKACGVQITALDTEFTLVEGGSDNITFKTGVLTTGTKYTATLIVNGKHDAKVKVSAAK